MHTCIPEVWPNFAAYISAVDPSWLVRAHPRVQAVSESRAREGVWIGQGSKQRSADQESARGCCVGELPTLRCRFALALCFRSNSTTAAWPFLTAPIRAVDPLW